MRKPIGSTKRTGNQVPPYCSAEEREKVSGEKFGKTSLITRTESNQQTKRESKMIIDPATYEDATQQYLGWCPECRAFTRESTEPDAESYDCPDCGCNDVMGAEQALLLGKISIKETP